MSRLLLLWERPLSISMEDAEAWAQREVSSVVTRGPFARADLHRLDPAPGRGYIYSWVLELHLRDGEDSEDATRDPALLELMGDLRLLGLHPALYLCGPHTVFEPR